MTTTKIGIEIRQIKSPDGEERLHATLPLASMSEKVMGGYNIEEVIRTAEKEYLDLIGQLKTLVDSIRNKQNREPRVLLYWRFGDRIFRYEKNYENGPFFHAGLVADLVRDIKVSEKMINRCRRFRKLFSNINDIDTNKTFDQYVASFEGGYISAKRQTTRGSNSD